ncbi:hypothetical protein GRF29_69g2138297 [Pseudopithomyces chartarum]|uniref:CoA-binding domain-containing protein n=1 Tax=Pseudopithomyces chartarum TaxID=1892770 RepID=A0AAN6M0D7_9PLEO|nr:hypothetical protein GRF29_69g2138297 [Pseudopithomyces chartarum]
MEAALKTFFSSPRFAVAGASSDPTKYGHKVFAWYLHHSLPVTPLNPRAPTITVLSRSHNTIASPADLPEPTSYSLSVITPPAVTKQVLREAKEAGVPAVWLQPGSFDAEVLEQTDEFHRFPIHPNLSLDLNPPTPAPSSLNLLPKPPFHNIPCLHLISLPPHPYVHPSTHPSI